MEPVTPSELNEMAGAGFNPDEIAVARQSSMDEMAHSGFSSDEIQSYYGIKEPDMSGAKKHVKENIQKIKAEENTEGKKKREPIDTAAQPIEAQDLLDGLAAGWGNSFTGLFSAGQKSPIAVSENSSRAVKIASMVSQFAGDVPAMAAGMAGGAALGSEIPIVGPVVGGTAGAFAVPPAMRRALIDQYEKGDIKSAGDMSDRLMAASWEGFKGGVTGAATALTGGVAGAYVGTAAKLAVEAGTMATVSSALEGHLPEPEDFTNGLIMIGGFHALGVGGKKMYDIYARTGLKPEEVAERAKSDPVLKQEILSVGDEFPKSLEPLADKEPTPEEPKPLEQSPEMVEAREKIRSQIGERVDPNKPKYGLKDAYQDYVDKLDPVKAVEGEDLAASESPYKLARMANDFKAKVKHVIERGTIDFKTLKINGKGLTDIIAPVLDHLDQFEEYIVSKRALELESQGRKSGFDIDAAKTIVQEGGAKFEKTSQELVEFQNRNLKYFLDSGRITQKAYDSMVEMGKNYVSFARILDPETYGPKASGKANPLRRLKGSDSPIQSPFISLVENTEMLFKLAEMNRAKTALVEQAEKTGNIDQFKKVPGSKIKAIDAAPEVNKLIEGLGHIDEFKVFRSQEKALQDNQFEVFREGKREVYEIKDERLARALKSLDGNPATQNLFFRMARAFTGIKRIGTTLTPDFILKNFTRDQLTAGVFSEHGTLPFKDVVMAMGDLWKKNDTYYAWLKSGGANGAFLDLNSAYLEKDVFKLNQETGFLNNVQNALTTAKDVVAAAGNIVESAPRLAEFKRVTKGVTEGNQVFEGGFASREITVDFQRMGLKTQALNSIAAFMNAQVQGLDRTVRALKEDPVGTSLRAGAMLTAPSVILWALQHDDERYKEIPQWQKDLFWCYVHHDWQPAKNEEELNGLPDYMVKNGMVDRGIIFRIPKPQELGLMFATLPERILQSFLTNDPEAMKDFGKTVFNLLTPNYMPDIIAPGVEHLTNYNLFTGRPLVPHYLEKELPAYRYTEYTSDSAKAVGKILGAIPVIQETEGASPMVVENYVKGWTGTLGSYALQVVDAALTKSGVIQSPVKPAWTVADIPFVKAFVVRNPTTQAESIQRFYDNAAHLEQLLTSTRNQMKKGNVADVAYIERHFGEVTMKMDGFRKALSVQSRLIRGVYEGDYTKDEKRQLIESTYYQMIETAKLANSTIDEEKKSLKDTNKEY